MRLKVGLFAPAVFMLLINAAPLPAVAAQPVNLASVDACSLITAAEMSAAVGAPMGPGEVPFIERLPGTDPDAGVVAQDRIIVPAGVMAAMAAMDRNRYCTWRRTPPPREGDPPLAPGQMVRVELYVMPLSQGYLLAENYRVGVERITTISGLGDDAYYTFGPLEQELKVKSAGIFIQVDCYAVYPADRQAAMDAERTIAAQVLSELQRG